MNKAGAMPVINKVPELVAAKWGGESHINIRKVSKETGINYPTTYAWIKGKKSVERVDTGVLEKWCKYLGVQIGDILVYEEDKG
jgi:DNA-binding Xre family transcriptional regulator